MTEAQEKFENALNIDSNSTMGEKEVQEVFKHIQASIPLQNHLLRERMIQWSHKGRQYCCGVRPCLNVTQMLEVSRYNIWSTSR